MSWLRSAFNRAAEAAGAGGRSVAPNIARVSAYAGQVVARAGDAVAGGAKLVLDRAVASRSLLNNYRHAVRRLEEVSLYARGQEREQALQRWVRALRELNRLASSSSSLSSPSTPTARGPSTPLPASLSSPTSTPTPASSLSGDLTAPASAPPALVGTGASAGVGADTAGYEPASPFAAEGGSRQEGAAAASAADSAVASGLPSTPGSGSGGLVPASPRATGSSPDKTVASVLFYDVEDSSHPLTFRDVFLGSRALENIVVSLVIQPPSPTELELVAEMFDLCLTGDHALHTALLSTVTHLSAAFASYGEVKMSREELLRMVSEAVHGLKINSQLQRLDAEEQRITAEIDRTVASQQFRAMGGGEFGGATQGLKQSEQLFSLHVQLGSVVRRKQEILAAAESAPNRLSKVDKTRSLSSELLSCLDDFEARITECKQQRLEALGYKTSKETEVIEVEKGISEELQVLHAKRRELEDELQKVMDSIASVTRRHIELTEEKEQFDIANGSIVGRLATEESELQSTIQKHKEDAKTLDAWTGFLEDSWKMQLLAQEAKSTQLKTSVSDLSSRLQKVVSSHLNGCKEELLRATDVVSATSNHLTSVKQRASQQTDSSMFAEYAAMVAHAEEEHSAASTRVRRAMQAATKASTDLQHLQLLPLSDGDALSSLLEEAQSVLRECDAIKEQAAVIMAQHTHSVLHTPTRVPSHSHPLPPTPQAPPPTPVDASAVTSTAAAAPATPAAPGGVAFATGADPVAVPESAAAAAVGPSPAGSMQLPDIEFFGPTTAPATLRSSPAPPMPDFISSTGSPISSSSSPLAPVPVVSQASAERPRLLQRVAAAAARAAAAAGSTTSGSMFGAMRSSDGWTTEGGIPRTTS